MNIRDYYIKKFILTNESLRKKYTIDISISSKYSKLSTISVPSEVPFYRPLVTRTKKFNKNGIQYSNEPFYVSLKDGIEKEDRNDLENPHIKEMLKIINFTKLRTQHQQQFPIILEKKIWRDVCSEFGLTYDYIDSLNKIPIEDLRFPKETWPSIEKVKEKYWQTYYKSYILLDIFFFDYNFDIEHDSMYHFLWKPDLIRDEYIKRVHGINTVDRIVNYQKNNEKRLKEDLESMTTINLPKFDFSQTYIDRFKLEEPDLLKIIDKKYGEVFNLLDKFIPPFSEINLLFVKETIKKFEPDLDLREKSIKLIDELITFSKG